MVKAFTHILLVSLISFVVGCANRAGSLRMLDERAQYGLTSDNGLPDTALKEGGIEGFKKHATPVRTREKVSACYLHYHELPTHDYFLGGWLAVVTEEPRWVMDRPNRVPKAPGVEDLNKLKDRVEAKQKRKSKLSN